MKRLFLSIIIGIAAFITLRPGTVYAQGPVCINASELDDYFYQYDVRDYSNFPNLPFDITPSYRPEKSAWRQHSWLKTSAPLTTATEIRWHIDADDNGSCANCNTTLYYEDDMTPFSILYDFPDIGSTELITKTINSPSGNFGFYLEMQSATSTPRITLSQLEICFSEAPPTPSECELVPNAGFDANTDWLLAGTATITNSTLTLSPTDSAAQNLSGLSSNTTYEATLDITENTSPTIVAVTLGVDVQNVVISGTGTYAASFNMGAISGPVSFTLENSGSESVGVDYVCISPVVKGQLLSCLSNDDWDRSGNSALNEDILYLANNSTARQSVSGLEPNETYISSINVSEYLGNESTLLDVELAQDRKNVLINGPGNYEVELQTPANLQGPYLYTVQHQNIQPATLVGISSICFYLSGSEDHVCVGPPNGDFTESGPGQFDLAANWAFFNGATWTSQAKDVLLPIGDPPMLQSAPAFTLPTVTADEYLLLSYEAYSSQADGGNIGSSLASGGSIIFDRYNDVPLATHSFEFDITPFSGQSVNVLFGNFGTADLVVDNVCVWTSDSPPSALSMPVDPGAIDPVDFGVDISCGDVDGILASFGINMAQHRSDYAAGISFWADPLSWIASAFWIVLADWSCIYISSWVAFLDIVEYVINTILNVASWVIMSFGEFGDWLGAWGYWLRWSWLFSIFGLSGFLLQWFLWGSDSIFTGSDWFSTEWGHFSEWLLSLFQSGNGSGLAPAVLSLITDYIPGASLLGFLLWLVDILFGLFIDLASTIFTMMFTFFWWIWENIIQVGNVPLQFYYGFETGINSPAYTALISCADNNFWCAFLAGVQIVNVTLSHTVFYPIVIVGIILSTIVILWRNIIDLFSFS